MNETNVISLSVYLEFRNTIIAFKACRSYLGKWFKYITMEERLKQLVLPYNSILS